MGTLTTIGPVQLLQNHTRLWAEKKKKKQTSPENAHFEQARYTANLHGGLAVFFFKNKKQFLNGF